MPSTYLRCRIELKTKLSNFLGSKGYNLQCPTFYNFTVIFFNFLHILRELLISSVLIVALIEHNQECNIENNDKFVTIAST